MQDRNDRGRDVRRHPRRCRLPWGRVDVDDMVVRTQGFRSDVDGVMVRADRFRGWPHGWGPRAAAARPRSLATRSVLPAKGGRRAVRCTGVIGDLGAIR
nr:hypothetical protein RSP597_23025 [Ralstonia solanacearum]